MTETTLYHVTVEQSSSELRCEADYDDWVDIAESEFVDYVEGRR